MSEHSAGQPTIPEEFSGGDILLASDSLVDPGTTLARIDQIVDAPDGEGRVVPDIELELTTNGGAPGVMYYFTNGSGARVAEACLSVSDEMASDNLWRPTVLEGFENQGFGTAMYLYFIRQSLANGHDFRSDMSGQTEDAVRMWRRLRDMGIAQAAQEFSLPTGKESYEGYYVVNGNGQPKRSMLVGPPLDLTKGL